MRLILAFITLLLFFVSAALAQDQEQFCKMTQEQAAAQATLLRTPSATGGLSQAPIANAPAQFVGGTTASIASIRKAGLTMRAANTACGLYAANEDIALRLQYAIAELERQALANRVLLDNSAIGELGEMIAANEKKVTEHDLTAPALYSLESSLSKLLVDSSSVNAQVSVLYEPEHAAVPLRQLIDQYRQADHANQLAVSKLAKASDWDVTLEVGARHQAIPFSQGYQPYGTFNIQYNLGRRKADKHQDNAVEAEGKWINDERTGVVQAASILREQLTKSLQAQETRYQSLQTQLHVIDMNLKSVKDVETTNGLTFRNSLEADRITLSVELRDAQFRIAQLAGYLEYEF